MKPLGAPRLRLSAGTAAEDPVNLLAISGLALEVVDGQRQVEVVVYQRGEPFHVKHRYSVLEGAARARRRWSGVEQGDRGDALSDETGEGRSRLRREFTIAASRSVELLESRQGD